MKIAVILAGLLFAYVAAEDDECPLMVALKQGLKECSETLKPSEETLKNLKDDEGVDDKDTNCLRACMLNKAGLMNNAKLDLNKMEEMMKSGKNADQSAIEAVMAGMKQCREESEKSTDACEVAGGYAKCFRALKKDAKAE